jgi:hypothetical protein
MPSGTHELTGSITARAIASEYGVGSKIEEGEMTVMKRLRFRVIGPVLVAGLTLTACSSSSSQPAKSTTTSAAVSIASARSAYLAAINQVKSALTTFGSEAGAWTSATTAAQASAQAQPAIAALQKLNTTLTNDKWPSSAASDIHSLVISIGSIIGDFQTLSTITATNASTWQANFLRDSASLKAADALVRSDLGLPADSSS